jgi:hypothetical protein
VNLVPIAVSHMVCFQHPEDRSLIQCRVLKLFWVIDRRKVNFFLVLKYHILKTYWGVEVPRSKIETSY